MWVAVLTAALLLLSPVSAHAFGTVVDRAVLDQHAEHEMITRNALTCRAETATRCLDGWSLYTLAGGESFLGAVGEADRPLAEPWFAHCDDADYLSSYPEPAKAREQATEKLRGCRDYLAGKLREAVADAGGVLDGRDRIVAGEVERRGADCTQEELKGLTGRAKCRALGGLGRALHGAQDFYSHSNWSDTAGPGGTGLDNPPGLQRREIANVLDLTAAGMPPIAEDALTTGCFDYHEIFHAGDDMCEKRLKHETIAKDTGTIPLAAGYGPPYRASARPDRTGRAPITPHDDNPRSLIRDEYGTSNFESAVLLAIDETRRQWADFRSLLRARQRALVKSDPQRADRRTNLIMCALAHDTVEPRRRGWSPHAGGYGPVRAGWTKRQVRRRLGRPQSTGTLRLTPSSGIASQTWYWSPGFSVTFDRTGRLQNYQAASCQYETARGVRVGDTERRLRARYRRLRLDRDARDVYEERVLRVARHPRKRRTELRFVIREGLVWAIRGGRYFAPL